MKTLIFSIIAGSCMMLTSACTGDTTTVEEQPAPQTTKETVIIKEVEKPVEPANEGKRGVEVNVNDDGAGVKVEGKKGTKVDVNLGDPK